MRAVSTVFLLVSSAVKSLLSFESKSLILYEAALSASLHAYVRLESIKPIVSASTKIVHTVFYTTSGAIICSLVLTNMLGLYSTTSSRAVVLIGALTYLLPNAVARMYAYSTLNAYMPDAQVRPGLPTTYLHARYPFGVVSRKKLESICLKYSSVMVAKVLLTPSVFLSLKNSKMYSEETLNTSLSLCPDFELSLADLLEASRCLQ